MSDLVALARARGLEQLAGRLASSDLAEVPPSLDALPPQSMDPATALGLMRRRGLDPMLVRRVLVWLEDRPLELGLFSWDALSSALLAADEAALLSELRKNALRVRPLLPAPASTFVHSGSMTTEQAVDQIARGRCAKYDDDALTHAATEGRALGALEELRRRHGVETLAEGGAVDSTIHFARLLHLSHMSTLASLYADYAFRVLRARAALPELVEILLDVGATDSLPSPSDFSPQGTVEQLDLLGYAAARAAIVAGKAADVVAELRANMRIDYRTMSIDEVLRMPRSHVVLADAAAEQNQVLVPFEIVDQIATANADWRYAHRVRAVMSGVVQETAGAELPLLWVENYLDVFGNDFSLWFESGIVATNKSWRGKLVARAAAEVAALPHDFMAWAGLAALIDADGSAVAEVNALAASQCELVRPA